MNSFDGLAAAVPVPAPIDTARLTLPRAQWQIVLQTVWRPEPALGIAAGGTDTGQLSRKALDGALDDAWLLRIVGKERCQREVPVPARLMAMLRARPVPLGLESAPPDRPLVAHWKTGAPLRADKLGLVSAAGRFARRVASLRAPRIAIPARTACRSVFSSAWYVGTGGQFSPAKPSSSAGTRSASNGATSDGARAAGCNAAKSSRASRRAGRPRRRSVQLRRSRLKPSSWSTVSTSAAVRRSLHRGREPDLEPVIQAQRLGQFPSMRANSASWC